MAYLNVEEIEAALEALAASYPDTSRLIALPNPTPEGRQSHALRIGPADADGTATVVIIGGMHAREWVPPDALVYLAADLLEAHSLGTGLRYGGQSFSADGDPGPCRGAGRRPVSLRQPRRTAPQPDGRADVAQEPTQGPARPRPRLHRRRPEPQLRRALGLPAPLRAGFRTSALLRIPAIRRSMSGPRRPRSRRRATSSGCSISTPLRAGSSTCTAMSRRSTTPGASMRTRPRTRP